MSFPRSMRITVIAVIAALLAAVAVAPSASAGPRSRPDRASVSAVNFADLHPADIVGGTANDLLLRWTAGQQLTEGTVRITFPGAQWSTPLVPFDAVMDGHMPPGTFSVRPYSDIPVDPAVVPSPACDTLPGSDPPPFGVEHAGSDQVIVISGVTCAPGQSLAVLIEGVQAPATEQRHPRPAADHRRGRRLRREAQRGAGTDRPDAAGAPVMSTSRTTSRPECRSSPAIRALAPRRRAGPPLRRHGCARELGLHDATDHATCPPPSSPPRTTARRSSS